MEKKSEPLFFRPFPITGTVWSRLAAAALIAVFVFLFLYGFQPFGISTIKGNILQVTLCYGLVTLIAITLVQLPLMLLFPWYFDEDNWNVFREIIHTLLIVILVAAGNLLLSAYFGFFELNLYNFLVFLGYTIAVGIFPVVVQVLIRQIVYQKQFENKSNLLITQHENVANTDRINFTTDDGKLELTIESMNVLAIEAADNYVQVYYKKDDGVEKMMIRNTLKNVEDQLVVYGFFRSHRSYLINLNQIQNISGNAQGYLVKLSNQLREIPVSRRRIREFEIATRNR